MYKFWLGVFFSTVIVFSIAPTDALAQPKAQSSIFDVTHGPQGTGNYKGKRDRHEKPGPMNEKKRKKFGWIKKK